MAFDRAAFLARYCDEADDHLGAIDDTLVALEVSPGEADLVAQCMRSMHTLKGASRMLKVTDVGTLAHAAEDLLVAAREGRFGLEPAHISLLLHATDTMREIVHALRGGVEGGSEIDGLAQALRDAAEGGAPVVPAGAGGVGTKAEAPRMQGGLGTTEPSALPEESGAGVPAGLPDTSAHMNPIDASTIETLELMDSHLTEVDLAIAAAEKPGARNPRPGPAEPRATGEAGVGSPEPVHPADAGQPPPEPKLPADAGQPAPEPKASRRAADGTVRVPVSKLDQTIRLMEELTVSQQATRHRLGELRRLKLGLRKVLSRLPAHGSSKGGSWIHDELEAIVGGLDHQMREERELAGQMDRLTAEIQQHALEIRLMPIGELFGTLPRAVRDIANQLGKRVRLELTGLDIELDKRVLEGLQAPLVHLVRNAIDHGVESPHERAASNKDPEARLTVRASHQGGTVEISVEDDGRGIDIDAVKRLGLARGLLAPDRADVATEREVLDLLFMAGFSTAREVSDLSGRGVGLDVVKNQIGELKGAVYVESTEGRGTAFRLTVPVSLTLQTVVLARADGQLYAFPHSFVEETRPVGHLDLIEVAGSPALRLGNQLIPVVDLVDVLGMQPAPSRRIVVIGHAGGDRVAFGVDEIAEIGEVVLKPVPRGLKAPLVGGFCTVEHGDVVPVLHVPNLIKALWNLGARRGASRRAIREPRRILVVDDSPNTREVERVILEAAGFTVDTAKDGEDALMRIGRKSYHLVVSDIEMPRVDGFTLCRRLREDPATAALPVVLVTSRATDADKRLGVEVGADAYIEKGSFDQDHLIETVRALLAALPDGD